MDVQPLMRQERNPMVHIFGGGSAVSSDEATTTICPHCHCKRVQWSHAVGLEHVARFLAIGFYRCRECHHRFAGYRRWGRKQAQTVLIILGILAMTAFVWLMLNYFKPWQLGDY
jgi:hypothetical protein